MSLHSDIMNLQAKQQLADVVQTFAAATSRTEVPKARSRLHKMKSHEEKRDKALLKANVKIAVTFTKVLSSQRPSVFAAAALEQASIQGGPKQGGLAQQARVRACPERWPAGVGRIQGQYFPGP